MLAISELRYIRQPKIRTIGRVEERRGGLGHKATPRFLSPLIEPDGPISGIRLSDWLHLKAHGVVPGARA